MEVLGPKCPRVGFVRLGHKLSIRLSEQFSNHSSLSYACYELACADVVHIAGILAVQWRAITGWIFSRFLIMLLPRPSTAIKFNPMT